MAVSVYDGSKWIKLGVANIYTTSGWRALHPLDRFYYESNTSTALGADCRIYHGTLSSSSYPTSAGTALCHFYSTSNPGTLTAARVVDGVWQKAEVSQTYHEGYYSVRLDDYYINNTFSNVTIALFGAADTVRFTTTLTQIYPE